MSLPAEKHVRDSLVNMRISRDDAILVGRPQPPTDAFEDLREHDPGMFWMPLGLLVGVCLVVTSYL